MFDDIFIKKNSHTLSYDRESLLTSLLVFFFNNCFFYRLRPQNSSNNQVLKKSPDGLIRNSELNNFFNLNQIFNDFDNEDIQIDKENFYILGSGSFGVVIRASYKGLF